MFQMYGKSLPFYVCNNFTFFEGELPCKLVCKLIFLITINSICYSTAFVLLQLTLPTYVYNCECLKKVLAGIVSYNLITFISGFYFL